MNTKQEKIKQKPPLNVGDIFTITPSGMAEKDPYYVHEGFIIFIKKLPQEMINETVTIRITAVKTSFAFSEYTKTTKVNYG